MKHIIRTMGAEDIQQVQQVAKTSWNHTYAGIIPSKIQERFLESAYSDEIMSRRLNGSYMYVAEVNQKVVGFVNFSPVKEDGITELGAIYLYPEFQGKGIGTALLNEGIKTIEGAKEFYINVEKENKSGTTFYIAKGFEVVSEFDDNFDGHILKTVRMKFRI